MIPEPEPKDKRSDLLIEDRAKTLWGTLALLYFRDHLVSKGIHLSYQKSRKRLPEGLKEMNRKERNEVTK